MRASGPAGINLSSRNLPVSGTCLAGLLKRTTTMSLHHDSLTRAAAWIAAADGIIITAGAGMGVDSGLPDFRGPQGFWKAYPDLGKRKLRFEDIASPEAFRLQPRLAWGFYGHRLELYRTTTPHAGFSLLKKWADAKPHGAFIYTSNVDGQFQKAGFPDDHIIECHGSIHHLQCLAPCSNDIRPADGLKVYIDSINCEWLTSLPACPACGGLARPNILMFNDWEWLPHRVEAQRTHYRQWPAQRPVVIEIGAGTAIPSVRRFGEALSVPMVRINPREPDIKNPQAVGLPMGALEALQALDRLLA